MKYKAIDVIKHQVIARKYTEYHRTFTKLEEEETLKAIEHSDLVRALEAGVQTLPEKTQTVFRMNRMEGQSVAEIASLLKLSEKPFNITSPAR